MKSSKDNSIEKLRRILLQEDSKKLEIFATELQRLKEQLTDQESLIEILDPVIADLLDRKISDSKDDMAEALAPVMGDAIRKQISEVKEDMVDALYPIIGQTIRKSVAESMKNMAETINRRIDQAIHGPLLTTLLKSRLTGISKGELVLKDAFPFQVDEIFLIHKDSGLLIAHASSSDNISTMDKELVSGMLTAIRDFVNEAFHSESVQDLQEIQYGDSKILLDFGRNAYLAFVVSGVEPTDFKDDIHKLARKLHNRYHKEFRNFDGDLTIFGDITRSLQSFINQRNQEHALKSASKSKSYLKYIFAFVFSLALIIWLWSWFPGYLKNLQLESQIKTKLNSVAGHDMVDLHCDLVDGWMNVSGEVGSMETRNMVDSVLSELTELSGYTLNLRSKDSKSLLQMIRVNLERKIDGLKLSENSGLRFIIDDDVVTVEGKVSDFDKKRQVANIVSEVQGVRIVINNLHVDESSTYNEEIQRFIYQNTIFFDVNADDISEQDTSKLNEVLKFLSQNDSFKLLVKGYSDSTASSAYNINLSRRRAEKVVNYLISNGLSSERIKILYYGGRDPIASNLSEEGRSMNRRVEFDIVQER